MKKTLLTLAAVAMTFALASCGTEDCVCDVQVDGLSAGVALSAPEMESCDDVKFSDLDLAEDSPWASDWDEAFVLVCEEE